MNENILVVDDEKEIADLLGCGDANGSFEPR